MPRNFVSITQEDINLKLAENIRSRENELMSYDFEAAGHQAIIDQLSDIDWDQTTIKYRGMDRDRMIAAALKDGLTEAQIQHVGDLNAKDWHTANYHAVQVETAKSERHYDNLLAALPEGAERDTAFAALALKDANNKG